LDRTGAPQLWCILDQGVLHRLLELLPDHDQVRAQLQDVYDTYQADGPDQAMPKFMAHAGLGGPIAPEPGAPAWQPTPEQLATIRAAAEVFLAHLLRPTTSYRPDIEALRAATPRVVVAVGPPPKASSPRRRPPAGHHRTFPCGIC
jgi:hypothetical protein